MVELPARWQFPVKAGTRHIGYNFLDDRKNKKENQAMTPKDWNETFVEKTVTYTLEVEGKIILIENVPARICLETGERLFSPETVERLQEMIWLPPKPKRYIQTPVYEFTG